MMKPIWIVLLEQLLRNRDRLASILDYLLDYLHDRIASAVEDSQSSSSN